jgi:uracil-DNA glycosylase
MEAKKINQEELTVLDVEPGIAEDERSLILLNDRPGKKIDETISTPQQYVSRYHYETKDLGCFLELCPHCRKPSVLALRKTIVDTAIEYLNEKEALRERRANRRRNFGLILGLICAAGGLYYVFFHLISGFRF